MAHSILIIVYHILKRKQPYIELGPTYYEEKKRNMIIRQSVKKLESLGLGSLSIVGVGIFSECPPLNFIT